jgi:uncharacterized membrane protein YqhA
MIDRAGVTARRRVSEPRSYGLTVVIVTAYAAIAAIVAMRTVLVAFDVSESIWIGGFVYGLTSRVTDAMSVLPGADREILGTFTVIDLSLVGVVLLFPLGMVASGGTLKR